VGSLFNGIWPYFFFAISLLFLSYFSSIFYRKSIRLKSKASMHKHKNIKNKNVYLTNFDGIGSVVFSVNMPMMMQASVMIEMLHQIPQSREIHKSNEPKNKVNAIRAVNLFIITLLLSTPTINSEAETNIACEI
jgi:hypothetical protein